MRVATGRASGAGTWMSAVGTYALFVAMLTVMVAMAIDVRRGAGWPPGVVDLGDALRAAAQEGDVKGIEAVLGRGVAVDDADGTGVTALMVAARRGSLPAVRLLLDRGARLSGGGFEEMTVLGYAARGGNLEVVRELLGRGADPNGRSAKGCTPLWVACMYRADAEGIVEALLSAGADPNGRAVHEQTALMAAAGAGALGQVRVLLAAGAHPWARDDAGETALDWVAGAPAEAADVGAVERCLLEAMRVSRDGRVGDDVAAGRGPRAGRVNG